MESPNKQVARTIKNIEKKSSYTDQILSKEDAKSKKDTEWARKKFEELPEEEKLRRIQ